MTSASYFDGLYADDADPWNLSSSLYEQRKLDLVMAALPRRRYGTAFEPGCAIGVTTAALADRCDRLLAMDSAAAALAQARDRIASTHVVIAPGRIPPDWPAGPFDLIVLSELLYYLDETGRVDVARHVTGSLAPGGDVLVVHWRHPFVEAATNGDVVHAELAERLGAAGLTLTVDHVEADFLLQVFTSPQ